MIMLKTLPQQKLSKQQSIAIRLASNWAALDFQTHIEYCDELQHYGCNY